jgi:hypothetical protein
MCKEMPVIPVNKVVDPKRIIGKKWRAEEEERHKGSLTQKKIMSCRSYLELWSAFFDLLSVLKYLSASFSAKRHLKAVSFLKFFLFIFSFRR